MKKTTTPTLSQEPKLQLRSEILRTLEARELRLVAAGACKFASGETRGGLPTAPGSGVSC
jgi:hypothetical protein